MLLRPLFIALNHLFFTEFYKGSQAGKTNKLSPQPAAIQLKPFDRRSGSLINTLWLKLAVMNGLHQYGSRTCPRFLVVSNPIRESILFAEAKRVFSLNNARGKMPLLHISASIWLIP